MIDHFDFRSKPFTREIAPEQHFQLDFIENQLQQLIGCVKNRTSGLIIAPPGFGKTSLVRSLVSKLPQTQFKVSYINVTNVSGRDLCREICTAIGSRSAGTYPAMVRSIQEHLKHQTQDSAIHPVIIFDDAHSLRPTGFEALKSISNFEMDSKLAVSYILVGHHSLKDKLHQPNLMDVRQRIVHCGLLRSLSHEESAAYIEHRLHLSGGQKDLFSPEAIEAVHLCAQGNMRAIDNLAFKSLAAAAQKKQPRVSAQHVSEARSELWT